MAEVQRVGQEALESVAVTVAASFADDPIWKWLYGLDDSIPVETGLGLARMLVAQSTPFDEIHSVSDHGAVALWTAPLSTVDVANEELRSSQSAEYAAVFTEQLGERITLAGQLGEAMRSHRPDEPHWYLGILGTHPDRQNQGLGSTVLRAMQAKADRFGIPTFLESSNPRNYGFYQRHGYTEADELTVAGSPPLLGFWRAAVR